MKKSSYLRIIITLVVFIFSFCGAIAQTGTIKGRVIDKKTKEPIPFASVVIEKEGKQIIGTTADFDGNYTIKPIIPGMYNLKSTEIMHISRYINNIIIKNDSITYQDIILSINPNITICIEFTHCCPPIITKEPVPSGNTYTSEEINKMAW